MDEEDPLLPSSPLLSHLFDPSPSSEIEITLPAVDEADTSSGAVACPYSPLSPVRKSMLHRSKTAPAMTISRTLRPDARDAYPKPPPKLEHVGKQSVSVLKYAAALLLLYLSLGVLIYSSNPEGYSGIQTHPAVDALYFCIVTLCTIGYGDIAPLTPMTKALSCIFVLVGFGILDVLLSAAVSYLLDLQESLLLASGARGAVAYVFDTEKGRMRIRMKVGIAVGVVVFVLERGLWRCNGWRI